MNGPTTIAGLREEIESIISRASGEVAVALRAGESQHDWIDIGSQRRLPAASIIKLAILLAVLVRVDEKRLALDQTVRLDRSKDVGGYGVLVDLPSIEHVTVRELLTLMVTVSDNTAANACIELVGLDEIADFLHSLKLRDTVLERRMMDFEADAAGLRNEVSASDAARLVNLLVRDGVLSQELRAYAEDLLYRQRVRDRLPRRLDPRISVGNKTGEVLGIRHDVGFLGYAGHSVAIAVLTQGFSDPRTMRCNDGGDATELIAEIGRTVGDYLLRVGAHE